jgi:hypothetical protein
MTNIIAEKISGTTWFLGTINKTEHNYTSDLDSGFSEMEPTYSFSRTIGFQSRRQRILSFSGTTAFQR